MVAVLRIGRAPLAGGGGAGPPDCATAMPSTTRAAMDTPTTARPAPGMPAWSLISSRVPRNQASSRLSSVPWLACRDCISGPGPAHRRSFAVPIRTFTSEAIIGISGACSLSTRSAMRVWCDPGGDLAWPAAADVLPDEPQAAAASASAVTPTATRKTEPGRKRPRDEDVDMNGPPPVPHPLTGTGADGFEDASKDAPKAALIAHPPK